MMVSKMKKIQVKVTPRAKQNKIVVKDNVYKVYVTAPAIEGRANEAAVEALAEYFGVSRSRVRITRGDKAREKVVEID
jgi:uncharacterized protein (TIGR00251 family)